MRGWDENGSCGAAAERKDLQCDIWREKERGRISVQRKEPLKFGGRT